MAELVLDASAMVDLLLGNDVGGAVRGRVAGHGLNAPAHLDAEVFSALGGLHRADALSGHDVESKVGLLAAAPVTRHPVGRLLLGAWKLRHNLRLVDALYVELAASNGWRVVTTDRRLRDVAAVDVVDG